ncbi:MAG: hypothetical protein Q8N95_10055 [Desulfobacterales bacterium]|nr:hypothetical protein [Desulfobacterales bacterium]
MKLERINYDELNPKAQEMFNFQKASAKLADYGFTTMWLNNDWLGADFLAVHVDGSTYLKVQLKGRLSFNRKYREKNIYICFISDGETYLYPHDLILNEIESRISDKTWLEKGTWSSPNLNQKNKQLLKPYLL